jgi:hypothetical protein
MGPRRCGPSCRNIGRQESNHHQCGRGRGNHDKFERPDFGEHADEKTIQSGRKDRAKWQGRAEQAEVLETERTKEFLSLSHPAPDAFQSRACAAPLPACRPSAEFDLSSSKSPTSIQGMKTGSRIGAGKPGGAFRRQSGG